MEFFELEQLLDGNKLDNLSVDKEWVIKGKDFKPVVRKNVTYVVAAVLFNEKGEVLMTQEGFHPHKGHWYLPAGRVDPNETFSEAAKREVREETGVECEPTSIIAVEAPSGAWLRITFTGHVTGGKLRTLAEKCDETLQGAYWPVDKVMNAAANRGDPQKNFVLRGRDILKLIDAGVKYHQTATKPHSSILPCDIPHDSLMIRPLIVYSSPGENGESEIYVLSTKKEVGDKSLKLPLLKYDPSITCGSEAVLLFCQEMIKIHYSLVNLAGLLGVEHNGTSANAQKKEFRDGVLMTVLVKLPNESSGIPEVAESCSWSRVTVPELKERLLNTYNNTNGCGALPFMY